MSQQPSKKCGRQMNYPPRPGHVRVLSNLDA
jgi:hypothetical protein